MPKRPGRPKKTQDQVVMTVRIGRKVMDRLDEVLEKEQQRTGYAVSRIDIVRRAINEFLERYE